MRSFAFALPLLAATAAFAQSGPVNPHVTKSSPSVIVLGSAASCPVGMRARQSGQGQTMWTISREDSGQPQNDNPKYDDPKNDNQKNEAALRGSDFGVHVELKAANGKPIHQVELEVSFLAPGGRVMPVAPRNITVGGSGEPQDPAKTFELSAESGAALQLAGDLLVGPAASITRVRVLRIEYIDRTTWQPHGGAVCSIEPDRFLLVGAR